MRRHDRMRNSQSHQESRMSATSEEAPVNNPLDAFAPRRSSERAEPRLAAISELARTPRLDALRPIPPQGDRLETAMSEFVRRQIRPEAVPEPADLKRDGRRRIMAAGALGVAGAVAIASVVALLFVTLFPREKDAIESFAAAVPPAPSQARGADDVAKAPLPQSRTLVAENDSGRNITHEQSERLLQQFVQWRQKAALTDKP
jgi:hypothetical protein